jgi:hypothetical protein
MGAVLVALLGLTVTKTIGVIRVAWLMRLGVRDALPWRRLAGITAIAVLSTVPVRWLQETVAWPPLATFIVGTTLYGATYLLLFYTGSQLRFARITPQVTAPESQVTNPKPQFSEPGA